MRHRDGTLPVVVIMEDSLFRQGISMLLESDGDITVVAQADSPAAAADSLARTPGCVVVLGASDDATAVAETMACRRAAAECKIVILSQSDDTARVYQLLDAGALGYVLKDSSARVLTDAVRAADRNEHLVDSRLISALVRTVRDLHTGRGIARETASLPTLTHRQTELMRLVASGLTNHQIASELRISESTVKNHLHQTYARLGVSSRSQAISAGIRLGIIEP